MKEKANRERAFGIVIGIVVLVIALVVEATLALNIATRFRVAVLDIC